ncbi:hypothetical protein EVJ50_03595 [Synechococcus sp. RSCCF101]|uniref:hypothetical protein n=1 Tax=Synechococcus sp. RSCCF101 TaxID=2511069 RepID=UPI001243E902|nr:hypothetical protein [Synechococcus sp. RSCCF101]QEY31471.1 hypothetical protein EVJ50_03595 [Synechococcus sp. RSCCF101]
MSLRVLVADRDEDHSALAARVLAGERRVSRYGFAASAERLIAKLAKGWDLILLDEQLPGLELAELGRQMGRLPLAPAVLLLVDGEETPGTGERVADARRCGLRCLGTLSRPLNSAFVDALSEQLLAAPPAEVVSAAAPEKGASAAAPKTPPPPPQPPETPAAPGSPEQTTPEGATGSTWSPAALGPAGVALKRLLRTTVIVPRRALGPVLFRLRNLPLARLRWNRYAILAIGINSFIWITSIAVIRHAPRTYVSEWIINLPVGKSASKVSLPDIGIADTSYAAAAATSTYDPRENFKLIYFTPTVLEGAAALMDWEPDAVEKPIITLVENTTAMELSVSANDAKTAQLLAKAVQQSFNRRLNQLRDGEVEAKERPNRSIADSAQLKLQRAQSDVARFKKEAGLTYPDMLQELNLNIEKLRQQAVSVQAASQRSAEEAAALGSYFGLSPGQAAEAFELQNDTVFQAAFKEYGAASAELGTLQETLGPNHPKVKAAFARQQGAFNKASTRAEALIGQRLDGVSLSRLSVREGPTGRGNLLETLVQQSAEARSRLQEYTTLEERISELEGRLTDGAETLAELEVLQRDVEIAEAIFASTLAKIDLGQAERFAAYPIVQVIEPPNLPRKAASPKPALVLAGSMMATILSSVALWLLWSRKPWLRSLSRWVDT